MEKDKVTKWLQDNIHICLVAISTLFLYKPGSFESFGLFLLAIGSYLWYNHSKAEQITLKQVIDISEAMAEEVITSYMDIILKQESKQEEEPFDPNTFPPWSNDGDDPFDENNPFSEN